MKTLSLGFICLDEVDGVEKMLASSNGVFDQVVAVWTGSDPATPHRLRELGCEVHRFEWIKNFSAARNFAFSKCTGDFVAYMDTDETLTNPEILKAFLQETKANVVMILLDYYCNSVVYWKDRVIARGSHVWRGFMHEELMRVAKYRPAWLEGPVVVHDYFSHAQHGKEDRLARNLDVARRSHNACPTPVNVHDMAMALFGMAADYHAEAIKLLWRVFALHSRPDVKLNALRCICVLASQSGDVHMLSLASRKMVRFAPQHPAGYFKRALLHYLRGEFPSAVAMSESGFTRDYLPSGIPEPYEEYSLDPARIYVDSLTRIGQSEQAARVAREALKTYPSDLWLIAASASHVGSSAP